MAVEHQLVLAAHHVGVRDEESVYRGAVREHLPAEVPLARVVRRSVDVDYELRSGLPLHLRGAQVIPDVLAHIDANLQAVDDVQGAAIAWREVPFLVEDTVVGKIYLVVNVHQPAVPCHGGGVA